VPSKNRRLLSENSACDVPAAVPLVRAVSCATFWPSTVGKATLSGDQVAPGTPGPPAWPRMLQPRWPSAGSVRDE
jgi:hypothetical protein